MFRVKHYDWVHPMIGGRWVPASAATCPKFSVPSLDARGRPACQNAVGRGGLSGTSELSQKLSTGLSVPSCVMDCPIKGLAPCFIPTATCRASPCVDFSGPWGPHDDETENLADCVSCHRVVHRRTDGWVRFQTWTFRYNEEISLDASRPLLVIH